ncbi:MAG: hypothetical protein U1F44_03890 [Coriobacteriia bacterium]|nr:hypothetical protein [Coriobacteriia bacterium]
MVKQTVPDMKELFRQAAEIAQQVPENMQEAAFNRALDLLVGAGATPSTGENAPSKPKSSTKGQESPAPAAANDLVLQIDSTQHPGVRSATRVLDRALMVLQIALRDHGVDGLTPSEISRVLTEKFRLRTTAPAVRMALKDVSDLVDRVPDGRKGYRYRIMGPGEEYVSHVQDAHVAGDAQAASTGTKRETSRRARRASAGGKKAKVKSESSSPTPKAKPKRVTSSKLGPKAAITGLIEEGYFATPRTGPEVQAYLQKKRGFALGTDQLRLAMLRLVRDGALARDENDEGQYEYKRP